MTSTNIVVGFGEGGKNSSKVLKPPGGGSSDIFGGDNPSTPRSVKNRMQSNIFAAPSHSNGTNGAVKNGAADRRGKTNGDSHNRLFGEPDRQFTPAKNHMKSNIPIGGEKGAQTNGDHHATNGTNGTNGVAKTNGHHQNGGSSSSASSTNGDHVDHQVNGGSRTRVITGKQFNGRNYSIMANQDRQKQYSGSSSSFLNGGGVLKNNIQLNQVSPMSISSMTSSMSNNTFSPPHSARSLRGGDQTPRRNPVTGEGCVSKDMMMWTPRTNGFKRQEKDFPDGIIGYQRPRKLISFRQENGNPVTGEGFKSEINTVVPSLNGANQVINKNRIPPGGFSSGLW